MNYRSWARFGALLVLPAAALTPHAPVSAASTPSVLNGAVPDVVAQGQAQQIGQPTSSQQLKISVVLKLRNQSALESYLHGASAQPGGTASNHLTLAQANADYNPTPDQEQSVITWLKSNGLSVTGTYPNHVMVDAQGPVSGVQALFHTQLKNYRAVVRGHERDFFSPASAPQIDAQVAPVVASVVGLDSFPRIRTLSNGSAHNSTPYYPQDFANAYDVNPLWNAGYTGSGQHIGITLWTVPPSSTALTNFANATHANVATTSNGRLNIIPVDGGTTTSDGGEAGMDIEYSSGMAPGATVDYYEAPTDAYGNPTDQGLIDALNKAGTDSYNNSVITNSWGGCEASSSGDTWTQAVENIFASNSATGHNFFFSSGDNGSSCTYDGTTYQNPQPDYPASSPHVVSVGGTAFTGTVNGSNPGETAWVYNSTGYYGGPEGSGGGYSNIFGRPTWETAAGIASNGRRGYPDVSADADPNTGALVYYGSGSGAQIGGTSLASPLWAGMMATVNSYLAAQGKPVTGFLSPRLYTVATSAQPYPAFHDVKGGTNGYYNAGSGWDAVTGLGSPDAYNLARDLAGASTSTTTPTPTSTSTSAPTATATSTVAPTSTVTAVPTATKTPAPTATSVPTNTPAPAPTSAPGVPTALLQNGGFESGLAGWQTSSSTASLKTVTGGAHSGSFSLMMCNVNNCTDRAWQTITVPTTFSLAQLSFWYWITTTEGSTTCNDALSAQIRNTAGTVLGTVRTLCNTNRTTGWVQSVSDVTSTLQPYAGQQVQVAFQGSTNTLSPSAYYLDDVSLSAVASANGNPVSTPVPTATSVPTVKPTSTTVPTSVPTVKPTVTPTQPTTGCSTIAACQQTMLSILNQDRASLGRAPLTLNLTQSNGTSSCVGSGGHSTAMAATGTIWHTNPSYPQASFPNNICVSYYTAGENVGMAGSGNEVNDLKWLDQQMMAEPHDATTCSSTYNHACNIINPNFHQVGIGVYYANGATWLTEDFTN